MCATPRLRVPALVLTSSRFSTAAFAGDWVETWDNDKQLFVLQLSNTSTMNYPAVTYNASSRMQVLAARLDLHTYRNITGQVRSLSS